MTRIHRNYYWVNATKRRYYRLYIVKDLLGDLCIVRTWGSLDNPTGAHLTHSLLDPVDFERQIKKIIQQRQRRGYQLKTVATEE